MHDTATVFWRSSARKRDIMGDLTRNRTYLAQLLPCHPCPHMSSCCRRGVSVTEDEAAAIVAEFGANALVWNEEEKGYRTRVQGQRCLFYDGNGCILHNRTIYPRLCLNYPWFGMDGQLYEYEIDICPEMLIRPDLMVFLDERKHLRPSAIRDALEKAAGHR